MNNEDEYVNIQGLNKDELLFELWSNSSLIVRNVKFDIEIAKREMHHNYPDYVCGRAIKADIYNSDKINPYYYDRENGVGSLSTIVECMRANKPKIMKNLDSVLKKSVQLGIEEEVLKEALDLYAKIF